MLPRVILLPSLRLYSKCYPRRKSLTLLPCSIIYYFSRLPWNGHIPCVQCERETDCFKSMTSAHAQTFSLLPVKSYYSQSFSLFLSRGTNKAKIVSRWLCYQFLLSIFLFRTFFQNFYSKLFFQHFFSSFNRRR